MAARLILFCLTLDYTKILIPALVEHGLKVSSALQNSKLGFSKGISNYIALNLEAYKVTENTLIDLQITLKEVLDLCKIYYYGYVISIGDDARICIGNIDGETDITRVMKMKALW